MKQNKKQHPKGYLRFSIPSSNSQVIKQIILSKIFLFVTLICACQGFVEVDTVKDQLFSNQVFNDESSANSAILGIYQSTKGALVSTTDAFSSLSANDLQFLRTTKTMADYQNYSILPDNVFLQWNNLYGIIYKANSAIEGLENSKNLTLNTKNALIAESKFLRAYAYFYLVNFFQEVPLLKTTDVIANSTSSRTSVDSVYALIIDDLTFAEMNLPSSYSLSKGSKTRANNLAAKAFLARVFLYTKRWADAETKANEVIDSKAYTLLNQGIGIFKKDNSEAILQWDRASNESFAILGYFIWTTPYMACTDQMLASFELGDKRKTNWLRSVVSQGKTYYAPNKFTSSDLIVFTEYATPFRLAEQYLIRSEARMMRNQLSLAMEDINFLRSVHGGLTTPLPTPISQTDLNDILVTQRRVELFTEGAHRWFDLKRTNKINQQMAIEKPASWKATAALYPIPQVEITRNPNIKQNPGYEN